MSKKKIAALLVSGVLAIGIVGGSLAWYTAKDSVTNKFSTGSTDKPGDPDSGVKIDEVFDETAAVKLIPGSNVNKDVRVKNTASYDSFIKVKFTGTFWTTDKEGNRVEKTTLDTSKIDLKFVDDNLTNSEKLTANKWVKGDNGYYYYLGKVSSDKFTSYLLDSVTLSKDCDNNYKNLDFDVKVDAESIQASNDAVDTTWAPDVIAEKLKKLQ